MSAEDTFRLEKLLHQVATIALAVAKKFGAEGLIIRDAKNAELHYELTGDLAPLALSLADTPVLVIMLLPADDGEPGVEQF
jgi:hypothetical protein